MTENLNQTPGRPEADGNPNAGSISSGTSPVEKSEGQSPSNSQQSIWKKAWGYFVWFLDYLHWEEPAPPVDDTPKTGFKKWWADLNAFLDSLDEAEKAPEKQKSFEQGSLF